MDGHTTQDVKNQLNDFPLDVTHLFLSCGGNDALRESSVLTRPALSVEGALEALHSIREAFRVSYQLLVDDLDTLCDQITICTIYNQVPGISDAESTALALFNEIILEEASARGLPVIDLRRVCDEPGDYSSQSPIEPSGQGARKIAGVIHRVLEEGDFCSRNAIVFS